MFSRSHVRRASLLLSAAVVLSMTACGDRNVNLPTGPQEVEGTVERVAISLSRRGTHLLRDKDGEPSVYLESTAVSLAPIEGELVTLSGVYEPNTERGALPVLVVQKIVKGGDKTLKKWELPKIGITIEVPAVWEGKIVGSTATFLSPGTLDTLLIAKTGSASSVPFDFQNFASLSGSSLRITPLVLGLKRAASILNDDAGTWTVYVDLSENGAKGPPKKVAILQFTLKAEDDTDAQIQKFQRIVRTLKTPEAPRPVSSAPSAVITGTGSAAGRPCGGPAGILCPSGFYCQITDSSISSGVCRKM